MQGNQQQTKYVPRVGKYDNVPCMCIARKWAGLDRTSLLLGKVSKMVSPTQKKWLKVPHPNIIEKGVCDDGNASHAWNRFSITLDIENLYRNHSSLPDEQRDFFGVLFDIDLWVSPKIF